MQVPRVVATFCRPAFPLLVASLLAGCAYGGLGPPQPHYLQFNAQAPHGNAVTVCSAYGCRHKTPFTFTHHDIATLTALMNTTRIQTAADERKASRRQSPGLRTELGARPEPGKIGLA